MEDSSFTGRKFQVTETLNTLPAQFLTASSRKGFNFNILIIGDKDVGKSSLLKCIFNEQFLYQKNPEDETQITNFSIDKKDYILKKDGVDLHLTVHETVNFNQTLNDKVKENIEPIVEFLQNQMYDFFNEESKPRRSAARGQVIDLEKLDAFKNSCENSVSSRKMSTTTHFSDTQSEATTTDANSQINAKPKLAPKPKKVTRSKENNNNSNNSVKSNTSALLAPKTEGFKDNRIHVCLYCLPSYLTPLRPIDFECIKRINHLVPVVPVVVRSDSLLNNERQKFKNIILNEFEQNNIHVYSQDEIFFLISSFEQFRELAWGKINIEDPSHNDMRKFRSWLLEKKLLDLIDYSHEICYETFRRKLLRDTGFPDDICIHDPDTDFHTKFKSDMETDKNNIKKRFIDKIRIAENDINLHRQQIDQMTAKADDEIKTYKERNYELAQQLELMVRKFEEEQKELETYLTKKHGTKGRAKMSMSTISLDKMK